MWSSDNGVNKNDIDEEILDAKTDGQESQNYYLSQNTTTVAESASVIDSKAHSRIRQTA